MSVLTADVRQKMGGRKSFLLYVTLPLFLLIVCFGNMVEFSQKMRGFSLSLGFATDSILNYSASSIRGSLNVVPLSDIPFSPVSLESAINSATGTLFLGEKVRTFNEARFFHDGNADNTKPANIEKDSEQNICTKWNVVTTIFAPSEAVKRAARVSGWCTVIIADTKMALADLVGMESTVHFLSVADQDAWLEKEKSQGSYVGKFLASIPYKHFARKNIGYLYAIQHGAELLFDFDDDNLLPNDTETLDTETGTVYPPLIDDKFLTGARVVLTGPDAFNHHPLMGATVTNSWARGFPLELVQDDTTHGQIAFEEEHPLDLMESVGVLQYCANGNPDIDAIHRLVHPLPMNFVIPKYDNQGSEYSSLDNSSIPTDNGGEEYSPPDDTRGAPTTKGALVVPSHAFAPYNAQATVHTYKALWALLLPATVPGRVSDIWRGYFAQALFRDIALSVVFLPPAIVQDRNEHEYLADMEAELDLYFKAGKLIEFLSKWDHPGDSIPERMEALWIELYERGYIEVEDVKVMQLWLASLGEIGYVFPPISRRRLNNVVLMGQFNWRDIPIPGQTEWALVPAEHIMFWHQKWRQYFDRIVVRGPIDGDLLKELQRHRIDAQYGGEDYGYHSPMGNLGATLDAVKDIDSVSGVLYIHDDMMLNITDLFQDFDFENQIGATRKFDWNSSSGIVDTDGTYFGERYDSEYGWWGTCIEGFQRIHKDTDPRAKVYKDEDGRIRVPHWQQSDALYVPKRLAKEFGEAAWVAVGNTIFLECGFPKIVHMMVERFNATIKDGPLCTDLHTEYRGTIQMLMECPAPQIGYHPFKISNGLSIWNRVFEWAITGKSEFEG